MTAIALERAAGFDEGCVGRITTSVTITNDYDAERAESGLIAAEAVRAVELPQVLVDTGATTLCLPRIVIERLGLRARRDVAVTTATGTATARLYFGAHVGVLGREGVFECLELPDGTEPLLGYTVMETLGLEPDMRRHELRVLPMERGNSYLRV